MNVPDFLAEVRLRDPPAPMPAEMPPTLLGMPIIECSDPSIVKDGEFIIGSFPQRFDLQLEHRDGKFIATFREM